MKASPGARSWIAAGVRHELLTRVLPALRHDMAAPMSVIRMGLLMLKRQASAPAVDEAAWEERIALVEDQVVALVSGVRSLRDWELAVSDDGITRSALVAQCTGLMRTAFEFSGIGLQVGDGLEPEEAEPRFPAGAAVRYMFLGALSYLHDSAPQISAIRVEAEGADALRFTAARGASDAADPMKQAHRAPRKLAIDVIALQSLADDLGYAVAVDRSTVRLTLAPA
ncbi:hypothetical protein [Variovorax sp. PBL-E5]|uniref:hypothetical protein n=1 Tax=Variovorax sp. PBL-E5 TaxID=434014 RepID=UPI001315CD67|nr:hypothetical protein [Variovorax sp. PBL-E5]VTU32964.1 hypothetical protein E5CHR_03522 [Variovorax sp. PBL-E5]